MDENATTAVNMAFAVFVLVIALSLAIFMLSMVATTAETLVFYSDSTAYYDNVELLKACSCGVKNPSKNKYCDSCGSLFTDSEDSLAIGTSRIVSAETIIPTLYRYYKENFCVKICDEGRRCYTTI